MAYLLVILFGIVLSGMMLMYFDVHLGSVIADAAPKARAQKTITSSRKVVTAAYQHASFYDELPTSVTDLLEDGLLRSRPGDPVTAATASPADLEINTAENAVTLDLAPLPDVCAAINENAGHSPSPTDIGTAGTYGCDTTTNTFYMVL